MPRLKTGQIALPDHSPRAKTTPTLSPPVVGAFFAAATPRVWCQPNFDAATEEQGHGFLRCTTFPRYTSFTAHFLAESFTWTVSRSKEGGRERNTGNSSPR